MYYHYFLINLLNFPHNVEEILHELQEDADFLEKQTIGGWLNLLRTRKVWDEIELQERLNISKSELSKMQSSVQLPSVAEKHKFITLLTSTSS